MSGMTRRSVKKVVVVHFLEAAKSALTHLSEWRMELSNRGGPCPPELTSTYADVRRIRDYLQKCMPASAELVDWSMSEADENCLVSCAVHVLREIDADMGTDGGDLRYQQKTWLREKQKVLVDWSVELATERVKELPAPATGTLQAFAVQELHAKVGTKLGGPTEGMTLVKAFGPSPTSKSAGVQGVSDFFKEPSPEVIEQEKRATGTTKKSRKATKKPTRKTTKARRRTRGTKATRVTKKATTPLPEEVNAGADSSEETLLDTRTVQDPRLRAFLALDLAAFTRALDARDHRLAIVHVSSILEAVVMDYILLHREELEVSGTPDGWNLKEFLLKRMGGTLSSKDRNSLYHLFSAGELLKPIKQFMTPTIVTPSTMEKHLEFAKNVLVELGYRGAITTQDVNVPDPEFKGTLRPKIP